MTIQDQFNKPNMIYKITKDIDLSGGTLTIPSGCTLDFQGGSINNGTLQYNSTYILGKSKYNNTNILGESFSVESTKSAIILDCLNLPGNLAKYNLPTDGITDCAPLLNGLFSTLSNNSFDNRRKVIIIKVPTINAGILCKDTVTCNLSNVEFILGSDVKFDFSNLVLTEEFISKPCFYFIGQNILFKGVHNSRRVQINGGCDEITGIVEKYYPDGKLTNFVQNVIYITSFNHSEVCGIEVTNGYNNVQVTSRGEVSIHNVISRNSRYDNGISAGVNKEEATPNSNGYVHIYNCTAIDCNDLGIDVTAPKALIENCRAYRCGNTGNSFNAGGGFGAETSLSGTPTDVSILFSNCVAESCNNYGFYSNGNGVKYSHCEVYDIVDTMPTYEYDNPSRFLRIGAAFLNQQAIVSRCPIQINDCIVDNCKRFIAALSNTTGSKVDIIVTNSYATNLDDLYLSRYADSSITIINSKLQYINLYQTSVPQNTDVYYKCTCINQYSDPIEFLYVGTSIERPMLPRTGFQYFDTTLGLPIYWNSTKWVKADGLDA